MAQRQALRELQSRLAERLQATRTQDTQAAWLAVKAGGRGCLFPLSQAGEIFPLATVQPLPYTQPWFLGVAYLRGGLYTVVDLAGFMHTPAAPAPSAAATADRGDPHLVGLNAQLQVNCVLRVDRLAGLRGMDAFVQSQPPEAGAPPYFGSCYTAADGSPWQEINLQALSQQAAFLNIAA